jgi:hypothetical protein
MHGRSRNDRPADLRESALGNVVGIFAPKPLRDIGDGRPETPADEVRVCWEDGASHACMHGSNLGNPHIKIRAYNAWASALTASHHQDDRTSSPSHQPSTHLSPSGTCEVYRLPAAGPFLTIETLHGKSTLLQCSP